MNTRLRFTKTDNGYTAGPFQAGTKTLKVAIEPTGTRFLIIEDEVKSYGYETNSLAEAKKWAKKLLSDNGVVFQAEVRRKRKVAEAA